MSEVIHDLVVNASVPFAFIILCICGLIAVIIVCMLTFRPNKLSHTEKMAELELGHREKMLKIEREVPKLVGPSKQGYIDNGG